MLLFSTAAYLKETLVPPTLLIFHSILCPGSPEVILLLLFASVFSVSSGDPGRPTGEIICKECIMVWVSRNTRCTENDRNLPENGFRNMYLYAL